MPIVNKVKPNPRVLPSFGYYSERLRDFRSITQYPMRTTILFAIVAILCNTVKMAPNCPGYLIQLHHFANIQVPGAGPITIGSANVDSGADRTRPNPPSNAVNDWHFSQ